MKMMKKMKKEEEEGGEKRREVPLFGFLFILQFQYFYSFIHYIIPIKTLPRRLPLPRKREFGTIDE